LLYIEAALETMQLGSKL